MNDSLNRLNAKDILVFRNHRKVYKYKILDDSAVEQSGLWSPPISNLKTRKLHAFVKFTASVHSILL